MKRSVSRIFGRFAAVALAATIAAMSVLSVSAAYAQGYTKHCLPIVTEPGKSTKYMEYYKDGKKGKVSDLNWVEDEIHGKVLSLSGKQEYLRLTSEPLPLIDATFTAWVNWQDNGGADPVLFTMTSNIVKDYIILSLHRRETDRRIDGIYFHFYHVDGTLIEWFNPAPAGITYGIPENEWHHIAFTVDEQYFRLYVDGQLWFEKMLIMALTELRANRFYIGAAGEEGDASTLKAKLADVCLYDQAMSAEQVARNMQTGENPFDSSSKGTTSTTTLYYPTTPPTTTTTTAPPTTTVAGPVVVGGFPLPVLLLMGGILLGFILLSVILSIQRKRGDR